MTPEEIIELAIRRVASRIVADDQLQYWLDQIADEIAKLAKSPQP